MNRKLDFTFHKYTEIIECLLQNGYSFQSFEEFLNKPSEKVVILRHDVDRSPLHSLQTARFENSRGIKGTYYFRFVMQSYHPGVIKEIASLGHEIGYHYEDVSAVAERQKIKVKRQKGEGSGLWTQDIARTEKELVKIAIDRFKENLARIRELVSVKTICMHGSPMSRWDSRILWKYYDYRDFGIIGEPYFDLDLDTVLYLTDTGRKWNGDKSSVRDKVFQRNFQSLKERLKTSDNILTAASTNELPQQMMITVHPQRWSDDLPHWMWEYSIQTLKNSIKQLIFVR